MYMIRSELKARAKLVIAESKPNIISVMLLYILLATLVQTFTAYSSGAIHMTDRECLNYIMQGNYEYAQIYMNNHANTSLGSAIVRLVLTLVETIVSFGVISFLLKAVRRMPTAVGDLLDGFSMVLRIIALTLLEALFIFLWSLLFIVPGIIAVYKYRQASYLLIDHPEMSPMQCIRESKRMMAGHKAELFWLDLSFIGWVLLSSVGGLVGMASMVWSEPYMQTTYVLYYEYLLAQTQAHDRWERAENI